MWPRMRQRIPSWCEWVSNLWLYCVNMNTNSLLLFIIPRTSWLWSPFLLSDVVNIIICYVFITFLIKLFSMHYKLLYFITLTNLWTSFDKPQQGYRRVGVWMTDEWKTRWRHWNNLYMQSNKEPMTERCCKR